MSLSDAGRNYRNWEEAADASPKWKRAVSGAQTIEEAGLALQAEIIVGYGVQPWWTVAGSPGIKIRRAKAKEVDAVKQWRPY